MSSFRLNGKDVAGDQTQAARIQAGLAAQKARRAKNSGPGGSGLLLILAFLFPFIGLIVAAFKLASRSNEDHAIAKAVLVWAGVGILVWMLAWFALFQVL